MADQEAAELKQQIAAAKAGAKDKTLKDTASDVPAMDKLRVKKRFDLKGHQAKISAIEWAREGDYVLSASQDGNLVIWDSKTSCRIQAIPLKSIWVMACSFAPGGRLVASGGLDNICSVYNVGDATLAAELAGHEGVLTGMWFTDAGSIATCSGDKSTILWDVQAKEKTLTLTGHDGGVNCVTASPDGNVIATGACDKIVRLWDRRNGKTIAQCDGHSADVNAITFFPEPNAFASASDDATCRLYDIRAMQQVQEYKNPKITTPATSLAFSKSGRLMFVGYHNSICEVWDTLQGKVVFGLEGHQSRVSGVAVHPDGYAVCTASWDNVLKIWA
eukprot:TRINITY_DN926_c4_g1_i1.p1 TRINITY_DN926_c4_g1~~TRINITY_DN926_c4_g1_i1.p1  ORF type:complete len:332 (+),score=81.08 TRINITY_DN926_c4_g1_i1:356-1351(+)